MTEITQADKERRALLVEAIKSAKSHLLQLQNELSTLSPTEADKIAATSRKRLPNRRETDTFNFRHGEFEFACSYSRYEDDNLVAEIFLESSKAGSQVDSSVRDSAIAASLALQYGCPLEELRLAALRNEDNSASTPLGTALDLTTQDKVKGGRAL